MANALVASRRPAGTLPPTEGVFAKRGLAYERKVGRALATLAKSIGSNLTAQPWFEYKGPFGSGCAVPDFILHIPSKGIDIVIEVKLTYKPSASSKLRELYLPVVKAANAGMFQTVPLIICKTLILGDWPTVSGVGEALAYTEGVVPTLQWLGHGALVW